MNEDDKKVTVTLQTPSGEVTVEVAPGSEVSLDEPIQVSAVKLTGHTWSG